MKNYRIRVIETRADFYVLGCLSTFTNYYLIIDETNMEHYYPISKVIIEEFKTKKYDNSSKQYEGSVPIS